MSKGQVLHVCKFDTRFASRVRMQVAWDDGYILDQRRSVVNDDDRRSELRLSRVAKSVIQGRFCALVFHMQSSLPYLLFALLVRRFSRAKVSFIYDMHDLHEKSVDSIYTITRFYILGLIEKLCFLCDIQVITVSHGLARICALRYRKVPGIVRNIHGSIPLGTTSMLAEGHREREPRSTRMVYFGLIDSERLPISVMENFSENDIKIDVFGTFRQGRSADSDYEKKFGVLIQNGVINYLGKYDPSQMEFLGNYALSIMPFQSKTANIRYSLPNKLFQSLLHGVPCFVDESMLEARILSKRLDGAIYFLRAGEDLTNAYSRAVRTAVDWNRVWSGLGELKDDSKRLYLSKVFDE